ncbi:MAG: TlpA family protein disulfide reductase [Piscinibacter sp.]|nr:TlpA family protein disulfide reductase [Piscinibacter sp.]
MASRAGRRILLAGTGIALASMGLGALLRWQVTRPPAPAAEPELPGPAQPVDIWNLSFPTPGGRELAMSAFRGRPLVLNFWATWCAPCIEEMPLLDAFAREQRGAGWNVVGLALDGAAPVQEFLRRTPVGFAIGLAQGQGVRLSRSLGNTRGALPFSIAFNIQGEAFARKLGALNAQELSAWASQIS